MACDFYVLEGKKLIDYKPAAEHYERAISRMLEEDIDIISDKNRLIKFLFLCVNKFAKEMHYEKKCTYKELQTRLDSMFLITDLMGKLTPVEFMRLFPISKEYDGEKCDMKDYFYTIKEVRKYPQDNPIGDEITKFLMEYYNHKIIMFEVGKLSTISEIRRMEGGKGVFEEFAEQNGLHLQTLYKDGNEMVDKETGERFKISKPKNPLRKLFSVVQETNV